MKVRAIVFRFFVVLLCVLQCFPAAACLWDYDTIEQERSEFPEVLELITGKFPRHSAEFYRWRIGDRIARIAELDGKPIDLAGLSLFDDLAVAYDKIGDSAKAIETIDQKKARLAEATFSDQETADLQYRTEANLGTFLIHSGDYVEGLVHIERAIEINPDAHFGREVYQQHLVEYLLKMKEAEADESEGAAKRLRRLRDAGFREYLVDQMPEDATYEAREAELTRALRGVSGMMRFGHHDSPILLTALGDLLKPHADMASSQLASRAYLRAAEFTKDETRRDALLWLAKGAIKMQRHKVRGQEVDLDLQTVKADFAEELADADAWYATLAEDEQRWIDEGVDVEKRFSEKYFKAPPVVTRGQTGGKAASVDSGNRFLVPLFAGIIGAVAACGLLWIARRRNAGGQQLKS